MNPSLRLIAQARLSAPLDLGLGADKAIPSQIQFMPPGRQKVAPFVNGEPLEMEINVTALYAEVFDRAAQAMLAQARAGKGDFPFTDFDHHDGAASSRPARFFWGGDDPKTGGVRMETAWTGSGKDSLANRDYLRFSPQWVFHKTTFEPLGLPVNVGGLVNRAAFKTIQPVASAGAGELTWTPGVDMAGIAAAAAAEETEEKALPEKAAEATALAHKATSKAAHGDPKDKAVMFDLHAKAAELHDHAEAKNKEEGNEPQAKIHEVLADHHRDQALQFGKQALADPESVGAAKLAEITATIAHTDMNETEVATAVAKAVGAAIKPLQDKITALETKSSEEATAQAKAAERHAKILVQKHVDRGAIPPQDAETVQFWTNAVLANASAADAQMGRLPGKRFTALTTGTGVDGMAAGAMPHEQIVAKAKDLRKLNPEGLKSDTQATEAYLHTAEGKAAYEAYRDAIVSGNSGLPKAQIRK